MPANSPAAQLRPRCRSPRRPLRAGPPHPPWSAAPQAVPWGAASVRRPGLPGHLSSRSGGGRGVSLCHVDGAGGVRFRTSCGAFMTGDTTVRCSTVVHYARVICHWVQCCGPGAKGSRRRSGASSLSGSTPMTRARCANGICKTELSARRQQTSAHIHRTSRLFSTSSRVTSRRRRAWQHRIAISIMAEAMHTSTRTHLHVGTTYAILCHATRIGCQRAWAVTGARCIEFAPQARHGSPHQ